MFKIRIIRRVKRFFQSLRFQRGITDADCWSFDMYLGKTLGRAIRRFIHSPHNGWPGDIYELVGRNESHADGLWEAIQWKMVECFESIGSDEFTVGSIGTVREDYEDEGLDLFREYFRALWD